MGAELPVSWPGTRAAKIGMVRVLADFSFSKIHFLWLLIYEIGDLCGFGPIQFYWWLGLV